MHLADLTNAKREVRFDRNRLTIKTSSISPQAARKPCCPAILLTAP